MADTLDVLTLEEGKDAINIAWSNTDHDTEIARHITAVSRMIDAEVGPVVQRTITAEIHDGGVTAIVLRQAPVASITQVRESSGPGATISTLSAVVFGGATDGYYLDQSSSLATRLERRYGGARSIWDHGYQIEVTYVAGRAATTAAVDARFKTCAASILRRLWKREAGTWAQSADFFESIDSNDTTSIGFYRVAKPIIDEMLGDQRPALVG